MPASESWGLNCHDCGDVKEIEWLHSVKINTTLYVYGLSGRKHFEKSAGCAPVVIPADIINAGAVRSAVCADYGHTCDIKKKKKKQLCKNQLFFPLNFSSCATSGYIAKRSDKELTTVGHLANGKRVAAFPLSLLLLLYSSTRQRSHTLAYTATLTPFSSHLLSCRGAVGN